MWFCYKNLYPECESLDTDFTFNYVEADSASEAYNLFLEKFNIDPIFKCKDCNDYHFEINYNDSFQYLTAEKRGCSWDTNTREWLEQNLQDAGAYISLEEWKSSEEVFIIYAQNKSKGMFCINCKDFYHMAVPNEGKNLRCYLCRQNPYR